MKWPFKISAAPDPCSLEATKERNQAGELHGPPNSEPGDHLRNACGNGDDVAQFLDGVADSDVLARDLEVQGVNDGLYNFGRTYQQLGSAEKLLLQGGC